MGRTNPLSTLKNVVLPAPFGPISPQVPPGNVSVIRSIGMTPPKRTVRLVDLDHVAGASRGACGMTSPPIARPRLA